MRSGSRWDLLFFWWYTDFGGPLSDEEIAHYSQQYELHYGKSVPAAWLTFWRTDTGGDFYMVNIFDLAEPSLRPSESPANQSAEQMMASYAKTITAMLFKRASHPVFRGDSVGSALDHKGPIARNGWTGAGLMRWRSRRTFAEMTVMPPPPGDGTDFHALKMDALDATLAFPTEPILVFDLRFVFGLMLLSLAALADMVFCRRR